MKKLLVIFALGISGLLSAQSNVGIGTTSPDASAKFEVQSSTQGLLIPRLTETQRNAINSPATSLTIYQTDNTSGFYYYDGANWKMIGDDFGSHLASQIVDMDTNRIINVSAPINGLDAVNKDYVDAAITSGGGSLGNNMPTEISNRSPNIPTGFKSAMLYCDSLTEGGNTDWIVPNIEQVTYAASGGLTFPDAKTNVYLWTRSILPSSSGNWVLFNIGGGFLSANSGGSSSFYVRCVR